MTTTYTFDVFTSVDGFGTHRGDWGGYWGKQGPELLAHREDVYRDPQRMVFGPATYEAFAGFLGEGAEPDVSVDAWATRMWQLPITVVSSTLSDPLAGPDVTLERSDALDVVRRLKEESYVPLRSHGSLRLNRALLAAGLVDRVQLTVFPVITGQTGTEPVFANAQDFDLELLDSHTYDGRTLELTYRPTLHDSRG